MGAGSSALSLALPLRWASILSCCRLLPTSRVLSHGSSTSSSNNHLASVLNFVFRHLNSTTSSFNSAVASVAYAPAANVLLQSSDITSDPVGTPLGVFL